MLKRVRHFCEYLLLKGVVFLALLFPAAILQFFGRCLGTFVYYVVPIRKKHALESLALAFPEKDLAERRRIVFRLYRHLGTVVVSHCVLPKMSAEDILQKMEFVDEDVLRQAFAKGKGVVLTGAHWGDWELGALAIGAAGYPESIVVAPIKNPYIDKMVKGQRQGVGVKLISSKGMSVRDILVEIKKKNCVGLLIDQSAGRTGMFVDFFGRKASTAKGPAQFAVKTGAPLVLCTSTPQDDGTHRMVFEEIPTDVVGKEGEEQLLHITQDVTSRIEQYIRHDPEFWFGWLHRRWKHKPPELEVKSEE